MGDGGGDDGDGYGYGYGYGDGDGDGDGVGDDGDDEEEEEEEDEDEDEDDRTHQLIGRAICRCKAAAGAPALGGLNPAAAGGRGAVLDSERDYPYTLMNNLIINPLRTSRRRSLHTLFSAIFRASKNEVPRTWHP